MQVLQYGSWRGHPVTKLLLTPISGRRHQLRVHLASIGHPILGDCTYYSESTKAVDFAAPRMFLHAWKLGLQFTKLKTLRAKELRPLKALLEQAAAAQGKAGGDSSAEAGREGGGGREDAVSSAGTFAARAAAAAGVAEGGAAEGGAAAAATESSGLHGTNSSFLSALPSLEQDLFVESADPFLPEAALMQELTLH